MVYEGYHEDIKNVKKTVKNMTRPSKRRVSSMKGLSDDMPRSISYNVDSKRFGNRLLLSGNLGEEREDLSDQGINLDDEMLNDQTHEFKPQMARTSGQAQDSDESSLVVSPDKASTLTVPKKLSATDRRKSFQKARTNDMLQTPFLKQRKSEPAIDTSHQTVLIQKLVEQVSMLQEEVKLLKEDRASYRSSIPSEDVDKKISSMTYPDVTVKSELEEPAIEVVMMSDQPQSQGDKFYCSDDQKSDKDKAKE